MDHQAIQFLSDLFAHIFSLLTLCPSQLFVSFSYLLDLGLKLCKLAFLNCFCRNYHLFFFGFSLFFPVRTPICMRTPFAFCPNLIHKYELFDRFRSNFISFLLLFDLDRDLSVLLLTREVFRALFVGVAAKY